MSRDMYMSQAPWGAKALGPRALGSQDTWGPRDPGAPGPWSPCENLVFLWKMLEGVRKKLRFLWKTCGRRVEDVWKTLCFCGRRGILERNRNTFFFLN